MPTLSNYIEAFQSLHTAKVKGVKAPHKAVLLINTYLTNQPTKTMPRISALTSVILTTMMAVA